MLTQAPELTHKIYMSSLRGTNTLYQDKSIVFNLHTGIIVKPLDTNLILGRANDDRLLNFVNLSLFGALSAGVSRQHAYLLRHKISGKVFVGDMDSSNGTYLNGQRLQPDELYALCHGDTLRLGTLSIRITFD